MKIPYSKLIYSYLKKYSNMKRKNRIIIAVGITTFIILFGYLFFFLIGPIMLAGPPCSLYHIFNSTNENHTVIVEIFDENDISVLKETYNLLPDTHVKYDRGIGWYPKISWSLITWSDGKYTFYVNLDNKYTEWYTTDVSPFCSVSIALFHNAIPLDIDVSCV